MIYAPRGVPLEAVRFSREEPMPDWCREFCDQHMNIRWKSDGDVWGFYSDGKRSVIVVTGDYICRTNEGHIFMLASKIFENMFMPLAGQTVNVQFGGMGGMDAG